jgi:hypothetical protein
MKQNIFFVILLSIFSLSLLKANDGLVFPYYKSLFKEKSSIVVFPNPAIDNSKIKVSNGSEKIKDVSVLDVIGNEVFRVTNAFSSLVDLNMSSLKKGKYFVKVKLTDGKEEMVTLIKQ